MDERHDHCEAALDIRLLRRDPAEVLDARDAAVLDDEAQPGVAVQRGDFVDVGDVKGIAVEGPDGRALVNVNVDDAELDVLVEILERFFVAQLVPAGIALPLGGVELDALQVEALGVFLRAA